MVDYICLMVDKVAWLQMILGDYNHTYMSVWSCMLLWSAMWGSQAKNLYSHGGISNLDSKWWKQSHGTLGVNITALKIMNTTDFILQLCNVYSQPVIVFTRGCDVISPFTCA